MAQDPRKSELIAALAEARSGISKNVRGLGDDLNGVHRIEASFRRHRIVWLASASAFGFLVARMPAGRKKGVVVRKEPRGAGKAKVAKAGLMLTTLKIAFDLARPALTKWLTRRVAAYADERFGRNARSVG